MIKVSTGEIRVQRALPWPVYDQHGRLLLNEGEIVPSEHALRVLLERGLYRKVGPEERQAEPEPRPSDRRLIPFDAIQEYLPRLQQIFGALVRFKPESVERIARLSMDIEALCSADADAVLGAIHLCQSDRYSFTHALHCAALCELVARREGWPEANRRSLLNAALTANVGMLDYHDKLLRQTEPLADAQRAEIHRHPAAGAQILTDAGVDDPLWLRVVIEHHERLDGSGYPDGLQGDAIAPESRLLALADVYAAMITPRAYRPPMLAQEALREIFLSRGKLVDERLSASFIKEIGVFPPGAYVRLANGEIAVVIKRGKDARSPLVSSVLSPRGGPYAKPLRRDCNLDAFALKEMCVPDAALPLNLHVLWGYS